jgi:hypothetical protein
MEKNIRLIPNRKENDSESVRAITVYVRTVTIKDKEA